MFEPCSVCGNEDANFVDITNEGDAIFLCENCQVEDLQNIVTVDLKTFIWEELK